MILWFCTAFNCFGEEIHDAAKRGDLEAVRAILAANPTQLDAGGINGHTPLTLSAAYGRWDVLRYLLDAGADVNAVTRASTTALHCVSHHDRPDMVALLLRRGAGPSLSVQDIFGEYTPMLRAVQSGSKDVVALLLTMGARPDEVTREGWNALHLAAVCGHRHLYGLLIAEGVSLDTEDRSGKRPMEYDHRRPDPIAVDSGRYGELVGRYTWQGASDGPGVDIFLLDGELVLDDFSHNRIYPIADDTFYCTQNPWKLTFIRDDTGTVAGVELSFLRRNVLLQRLR
jgi:hypothetical protein